MFVALELVEQDTAGQGIFGSIFNILTRPKPWLEKAEFLGARYGVIHAADGARGPDWEAIEALAGRFAGRMLLPGGLTPPPGSAIARPPCPRFEKKVLLATACELIRRTRMPMYRRILGVIDPEAAHTDLLFPLLRHYTSVRVVTGNLERYEQAAARMMEELGAPVLVGSAVSLLEGCVLILAPGAAGPEGALPCPVLAGEGFPALPGQERIESLRAGVTAELAARCPGGIAPHRFAAALHDLCGADPGVYVAEQMRFGYKSCTLPEAAQAILQASGAPAFLI